MMAQHPDSYTSLRLKAVVATLLLLGTLYASQSYALSEFQRDEAPLPPQEEGGDDSIRREQLPPARTEPAPGDDPAPPRPAISVPLPDPIVPPRTLPSSDEATETPNEPTPEIFYDVELLPEPVKRLRGLILEACLTGDIEQLRPLIQTGQDATQLSFGDIPTDPVEFLRELSGDDEGQEILAILYEVLSAGYVRLDQGEPTEMYVWPYFFAVPLEALDRRQRVELFKLVTAGDYEDMKNFGAYIFYRVGISPQGEWLFFVAGD